MPREYRAAGNIAVIGAAQFLGGVSALLPPRMASTITLLALLALCLFLVWRLSYGINRAPARYAGSMTPLAPWLVNALLIAGAGAFAAGLLSAISTEEKMLLLLLELVCFWLAAFLVARPLGRSLAAP